METETTVETVIGIAASAGGLEATSVLAANLPVDQPCAFVLAQHMSPKHESVLSTLLARETRLPVQSVQGSTKLKAGTLYVPIPSHDLIVDKGIVTSVPANERSPEPKPSADRLFASIAKAYGENSVGIVLSGTGSDGSYGVQDIREAGGITIAQDSETSKYDSMPTSAVATGCVDLVLSPMQIGSQLTAILQRPRDFSTIQQPNDWAREYNQLFQMLQDATKVNFRDYKETTILRRIHRRLVALGIEEYRKYVEICRQEPHELEALFRDLLISVTRFYRDPDQFAALEHALPSLVQRDSDRPLRIWVPGCATGEEAYSIAFMLCEFFGVPKSGADRKFQIFATDIDTAALARARLGTYPAAALSNLPDYAKEKYVSQIEDHIQVKPEIRTLVLFSRHNVFQDPPFSDIDLVSLRNTLIYFNSTLQERVMARLQYALRPGGLLFLGTSENIGSLDTNFERVSEGAKLFRKNPDTHIDRGMLVQFGMSDTEQSYRIARTAKASDVLDGDTGQFDALANAVAPTGFLANAQKEFLRIFGDLSPFMQVTDAVRGRVSASFLKTELSTEAASLIPLCLKDGEIRESAWREMDGLGFNRVRLRGYPMHLSSSGAPVVLVAIETKTENQPTEIDFEHGDTSSYLSHVEKQLTDAREALQITMEELQTSNEELQSANEELQSTNEELITVNEELMINSEELARSLSEQAAVLQELPIPILVLDRRLNVRSASNAAASLFGIVAHGKSLGHVSQLHIPHGFPRLTEVCNQAIVEEAIQTETFWVNGLPNELRVAPFYEKNIQLAGVTATIRSSVSELTLLQQDLKSRVQFLSQQLSDQEGIGLFEYEIAPDRIIVSDGGYKIFERDPRHTGESLHSLLSLIVAQDRDVLRDAFTKAIDMTGQFHCVVQADRQGEPFQLETAGVVLYDETGLPLRILGTLRDMNADHTDDSAASQLNRAASAAQVGLIACDLSTETWHANAFARAILGLSDLDTVSPGRIIKALAVEDAEKLSAQIDLMRDSGRKSDTVFMLNTPKSGISRALFSLRGGPEEGKSPEFVYISIRAVT